jgi:hypothetical protein
MKDLWGVLWGRLKGRPRVGGAIGVGGRESVSIHSFFFFFIITKFGNIFRCPTGHPVDDPLGRTLFYNASYETPFYIPRTPFGFRQSAGIENAHSHATRAHAYARAKPACAKPWNFPAGQSANPGGQKPRNYFHNSAFCELTRPLAHPMYCGPEAKRNRVRANRPHERVSK